MKFFISFFILLFTTSVFGQNIGFKDILSLVQKKDWETVNQNLSNKGWTYFESKEGDLFNYSIITWTYNKSYYDDKALGWINLYCSLNTPYKISYQFHTKSIYNSISTSILSSGFKKNNSDILADRLIIEFTNGKYDITLTTTNSDDDFSKKAVYAVVVSKRVIVDNNDFIIKPKVLNGIIKAYYDDGAIESEINYVKGKKHGVGKEFDPNGKLIAEYNYINDERNGGYKIYEGKRIKETGSYTKGVKSGVYKIFDDNGKVEVQGFFKSGIKEGAHTFYYYNDLGGLEYKFSGNYINDKQNGVWKYIYLVKNREVTLEYESYLDDVLDGPFKKIYGDSIVFCNYEQNEITGDSKLYIDYLTPPGNLMLGDTSKAYLKATGYLNSDLREGRWLIFSKDKILVEDAMYESGQRMGRSKFFYPDQGIEVVCEYKGELILSEDFNVYKSSHPFSGIFYRYYPESKIVIENSSIKNGKRHGITIYYDDSGSKLNEVEYINGVLR